MRWMGRGPALSAVVGRGVAVRRFLSPRGPSNWPVNRPSGDRVALRRAKHLAETGEVLSPDRQGTAKRMPMNRPMEFAARRAREEGRM